MNKAECLDLINEVERMFPVDQWTVGDRVIWPWVRQVMAFRFDETRAPPTGKPRFERVRRPVALVRPFASRLIDTAYARVKDPSHQAGLGDRTDAVLLGMSVSRVRIEDSWYERLCEPMIAVLDDMGLSSLQLELNRMRRLPLHNRAKLVQPYVELALLRSQTRRPRVPTFLPEHGGFLALLRSRGLDSEPVSDEALARSGRALQLTADFFRRIFEKVEPRLGFVTGYGLQAMAFNRACRLHGIPSIELQHGVQGDAHFAYARWENVPERGYDLLPSVYWTWGPTEAATIHGWAEPVSQWHRPVVGGNLWLERWRHDQDPMVAHFDQRMKALRQEYDGDVHVLVTLPPPISESEPTRRILQAIEASPSDWQWWCRPHPRTAPDEINRLSRALGATGRVFPPVDTVFELPLYALLRSMDVHVTVRSSSIIEADELGVPSVAVHDTARAVYPEQWAREMLVVAHSPSEIITAVSREAHRQAEIKRPAVAMPRSSDLIQRILANTV